MTVPFQDPVFDADFGTDTRRGLSGLAQRAIDTWIPESIRHGDSEVLRRARIVIGFTLILLLISVEAVLFFNWALPREAATSIDISLVLGLGLVLMIPPVLRRTGSVSLIANMITAGCYLVIVSIISVMGGMKAPVLHWCALMPMLSLLMGARRSAWVWSGISVATLTFFCLAESLGIEIPDYWTGSRIAGDLAWVQRMVDVGTWIAVLVTISYAYERQRRGHAAKLEGEIRQRKLAEERTHYLAYYDELTTLPNREHFKERLARAVENATRIDRMVSVLFLDLDGFKEVNDTLGHGIGDELLKLVAQRLMGCVRLVDSVSRGRSASEPMVSRLGGDEFIVMLSGIRDDREAVLVAQRILRELEKPMVLSGHEVFISASIGIAMYPDDGVDLDLLLRNADMAMYRAKEHGKNGFQFFTSSMNDGLVRKASLGNDLHRALDRDELFLCYQPIVEARSRVPVGVEALVRWQHPERGLLSPGEFIEIAERTGLIVPIGDWILRSACEQSVAWQQAGLSVRMAVNISSRQIRKKALAESIAGILQDTGLEPSMLEIEITENAMMDDEDEAARALKEIRALGVHIALDDFGTGYSSLSYIKRFSVDSLKIDRSFTQELEKNAEAQAITNAIIAMAHQLHLKVVAEGVETASQERFLTTHGCDELQGFLFGRPVLADELEQALTR